MNKNALSALSMLLLALTWAVVGSLAAPFGLEDTSDAASGLRQRKGSSPRSPLPLPISASPGMTSSEPIYMKDLSTEELFKALVLFESNRKKLEAASMAQERIFGSSIPAFLNRPPFTTREYLVGFDKTRPPVSFPVEAEDLHRSVEEHAFKKYFLTFQHHHNASPYKGGDVKLVKTGGSESMGSATTGWAQEITKNQVAKEGLMAMSRTREWADKIQSRHPEMLPKVEVDAALTKGWGLWHNGLKTASGYAYIPVQEIAAKLHRR
ncbi:uncharacterized protein UHO2_05689 [Ustilago hordei]|nr:uncharacterized protein UHO2_05689 [Ustilago hordei]SYW76972.1 uncharacterized protein UHO2_05689 [Ustilago hordei]